MPLILPRKSLLAFPAGRAPGIDLTHPACHAGLRFSGVASGNNFINLLHGTKGTLVSTPTQGIHKALGPTFNSAISSQQGTTFSGQSTINDAVLTYAVLINYISVGAVDQAIFSGTSNAGVGGCYINVNTAAKIAGAMAGSGFDSGTGIVVPGGNVPLFILVSLNFTAVAKANFLVRRLDTGVIQTATTTVVVGSSASNGTYYIGDLVTSASNGINGGISAAMFAPHFMSMSEMLAFADNPWAFWYPPAPTPQRQATNSYLYGPNLDAITTGGARVPERFNQSRLMYPAGVKPGFDPAHPASQGCAVSTVAIGPNAINLLKGTLGTPTGVSASIHSTIGPSVSKYVSVSFDGLASSSITTAAICVTPSSNPGAVQTIVAASNGVNNSLVYIEATTNELKFYNGSFCASGIILASSTPYFVAVAVAGAVTLFVAGNLNNGAVVSATAAGGSFGMGTSPFYLGNDQFGSTFNGVVAAGMLSRTSLTIPQLIAWAQDPWAFWYPRQQKSYFFTPIPDTSNYGACVERRFTRNKLAYPANRKPGIDLSHPAACGLYVSAIPTNGGNVVNLRTGKLFVAASATTVVETLGPTNYLTSGAALTTPGLSTIPVANTMAAIIRPVAISNNQTIIMFTDGGGDRGLVIATGNLNMQGIGDSAFLSGITLSAGVPYFVVASDPYNASFNINFVVKNLATGQVQTSVIASGGSPGRPDDTLQISNSNFSVASNSHIAAAMYSPNLYLSMPQLLKWAEDPWAFWYPRKPEMLTAPIQVSGRGSHTAPRPILRPYPRGLNLPGYQPRGEMKVDWSHPITDGLSYVRLLGNDLGNARALYNSNGDEGAFSVLSGSPIAGVAQSGIGMTGVGAIQYGAGGNSNYVVPGTTGTCVCQVTAGFAPTDGVAHLVLFMDGAFSCQKYLDNNWYCGWNTGSDYRVTTAAAGTFSAGDTFSVAITWDTAANSKLYTKGALRATNATAPVTASTAAGTIKIGGLSGGGGDTWNTTSADAIHYLAFWSRVLSTDEIALLNDDPYCFFVPAEPEMTALIALAVALAQYAAFSTPQRDGAVYTQMTGY